MLFCDVWVLPNHAIYMGYPSAKECSQIDMLHVTIKPQIVFFLHYFHNVEFFLQHGSGFKPNSFMLIFEDC